MQHADEVVHIVRLVVARVQLLGQGEERSRVIGEVVDIEDGLWVRDVVLFQVGVQTSAWSPAVSWETGMFLIMALWCLITSPSHTSHQTG